MRAAYRQKFKGAQSNSILREVETKDEKRREEPTKEQPEPEPSAASRKQKKMASLGMWLIERKIANRMEMKIRA